MKTTYNNGFTCLKKGEIVRHKFIKTAQITAATVLATGMVGVSVFCGASAFAQDSDIVNSEYANKVAGDQGMPSVSEWNEKMAQYDANSTLKDNEIEIFWGGVPKSHIIESDGDVVEVCTSANCLTGCMMENNIGNVAEGRADIVNTEGAATDWFYKVEGTELYITKTPTDDSYKQFELVDGLWDLSDIPSGLTKVRTNYDKFIKEGAISNISDADYAELMSKPYFAQNPTPQENMYYYTLSDADQIFETSLHAQMSYHSDKFDRCTISWKGIRTI